MAAVKTICVLGLIMFAVITDIKAKKIRNSANFIFMFSGIIVNLADRGLSGVFSSILGIMFPLITLMPLYVLRMLGAGDIKLFAAIGSIMGIGFVMVTMSVSFLFGGATGILLIAVNGYGKLRFKVLKTYLKTCLLTCKINDYREFSSPEKPGWFRLSLVIAPAVIAQLLLNLNYIFPVGFTGLL